MMRLTRIEELVETNLEAVENLAGAIEALENARKAHDAMTHKQDAQDQSYWAQTP